MRVLTMARNVVGLVLLKLAKSLIVEPPRAEVGPDPDADDGGPVGVKLSDRAREMRTPDLSPTPAPEPASAPRGSIADRVNVARARGMVS